MAYSDYGGYAYRNGERVAERSDFTITPGGGFGTPGSYPGFAQLAAGVPHAEVIAGMDRPVGHAVIGDGPVMVTLYKQTSVSAYRVTDTSVEEIDVTVGYDWDAPLPQTLTAEIDGHTLTVTYVNEDNYYCYARLAQPDGTVWTAFSGYGVGAGLEDCYDTHGGDTGQCVLRLQELYQPAA